MDRVLSRIEHKLDCIAEGQAEQGKVCSAQCEKVSALERSDLEQWSAITGLRRSQNIGIGIMVTIQIVGLPLVFLLLKAWMGK